MIKFILGLGAIGMCAGAAVAQSPHAGRARPAPREQHYVPLAKQPGQPEIINANLQTLTTRVQQAVANKTLTGRARNQNAGVLHSIRLETARMTASGHRMSKQEQRVLQSRIDQLNRELDHDIKYTH